jgi:hypothetical protein
LEMAIHASKSRSHIEVKAKSELLSKNGMQANNALRLRDLEIKNATLKKLLVEAYLEIAVLKTTLGTKQ